MRRVTVIALLLLGACQAPPDMPASMAPSNMISLYMGPFDVPPTTEQQLCQTFKLPSDEAIAVNRFEILKRTGSHHTILFTSDQDFPDQVFPCWGTINFDDWNFIVDAQSTDFDWTLPDGKAFVFQPNQQLMIQAHYQNLTQDPNTTETPDGAAVQINLYTVPVPAADNIGAHAFSSFIVNRRVDLPPHSADLTFTRDCTFNRNAYVFGVYGHFHSRGTLFTVDWRSDGGQLFTDQLGAADTTTSLGMIYNSTGYTWATLPFDTYPNAQFPGDGKNGLYVLAGETFRFACTYDNPSDMEIVYGSHAATQEHCNLFFHYSLDPADPTPARIPLQCTHISGGW